MELHLSNTNFEGGHLKKSYRLHLYIIYFDLFWWTVMCTCIIIDHVLSMLFITHCVMVYYDKKCNKLIKSSQLSSLPGLTRQIWTSWLFSSVHMNSSSEFTNITNGQLRNCQSWLFVTVLRSQNFNAVDFLWSCEEVFLLCFLGQIVTWHYYPNLLD